MKTERILGALYGQALGDAMGMPSELWPRSRVKAHFGWIDRFLPGPKENNAACYFNRAEFTDDTSMALCLADALLEREGKIDPDLIGRNILDWALRFDAFNKNVLGPTSKIALNAIRDGKPVAELENNGVTNGAAMRVSPLGCLLPARDVDSFIDDVALASSPTHKSDLAVAGAVSSHGRFPVPLTEKAGQRLLIPCLQLRDMHSKNASLPSAPHWQHVWRLR